MAYTQYIDLVNALRDRFNEPHIPSASFTTTVGFDQFCKDAINYAYHDILNAEMEWPFLHQKVSIQTVPGQQLYNVITGNTNTVKTIDWDSFFISPNTINTIISNETATIPSSEPYSVTPAQVANWTSDLGVTYISSSIALAPITSDPEAAGQYTILDGAYYFNAADAGVQVYLNYLTTTTSTVSTISARPLGYIDYDFWRQSKLANDLNSIARSAFSTPESVFKTQQYGEIGLTPIPDKIYIIDFECWVDGTDLADIGDTPLLPDRFNQILLDGATKYVYEFREDPQQAQLADARFKSGITRMRIELINTNSTMKTGLYWYPHGFSYTMNSL